MLPAQFRRAIQKWFYFRVEELLLVERSTSAARYGGDAAFITPRSYFFMILLLLLKAQGPPHAFLFRDKTGTMFFSGIHPKKKEIFLSISA